MRGLWAVGLAGCTPLGAGNQTEGTNPFEPTYATDTDTDSTFFPTPEEGHVALIQRSRRAGNLPADTTLVAVFADSLRGWINLPMCLAQSQSETFCAQTLPTAEDTWVGVDDYDDEILDQLFTRYVGDTLTLGPWSAPWFFDAAAELGSYYAAVDPLLAGGPLDLAWEGSDWESFSSPSALTLPVPMVVTSPDPLVFHAFTDQAPIEFVWEPSGSGIVVLAVSTWVADRLYLLADDGQYTLDLSDFGIDDGETIDLMIGRWNTETLITDDGHTVQFNGQSDQWIYGSYKELDGRTEVFPADTCTDVPAVTPIGPGSYWGDMRAFGDQINPGLDGCTGFPAQGAEGILPMLVPAGGLITVTYQLPNDDASLYLETACANPGTCIVGADGGYQGWEEAVTWFNPDDEEVLIYLVLDSYLYPEVASITDIFVLDVTLDVVGGNVLHDSCADAMLADPVAAGGFAGDLSLAVSDLNPDGTCAAPAPGGDGFVKIRLEAGETLTATASMPDSDLVLYLMYNCAVPASCVVGADLATDAAEVVTYANESGVQENLYLVVDSKGASAGYNLDIAYQ